MTADPLDGRAQVAALRHARMPVFYPRVIASGSSYCLSASDNCYVEVPSPSSYPRAYRIKTRSGRRYAAYRMTLVVNPILGEYYGVQGTTWQDPPILNKPTTSKRVSGKHLELYYNGGKLSMVAWHTSRGTYWISNTLTNTLSPAQMIDIAASLHRG